MSLYCEWLSWTVDTAEASARAVLDVMSTFELPGSYPLTNLVSYFATGVTEDL